MKKFLLLLALCGVMVACGDSKPKKEKSSKEVVEILDQMSDAVSTGDEYTFRSLFDEQKRMFERAGSSARKAMIDTRKQWAQENPKEWAKIEANAKKLDLID